MNDNQNHSASARISIYIAYAWGKENGELITATQDPRWKFLRELIKSVINEVEGISERAKGERSFSVQINRLRARHGQFILTAIRQRITQGDVLVMDIGAIDGKGFNSNVLLELGMALASGKFDSQSIYILCPDKIKPPSDLDGLLLTKYSLKDGIPSKLLDHAGFRAALRSTIKQLAYERDMIGSSNEAEIEVEGESNLDTKGSGEVN